MARNYYRDQTTDGGWAVGVIEDGLTDFVAYFRTKDEALACIAEQYARDAALDLLAACEAAAELIDLDVCEGADRREVQAMLAAAIAKAKGGAQ